MASENESDWIRDVSQEKIIATLTRSGRISIERCFLCSGMTCSWDFSTGQVSMLRMEDNRLFAACQHFLEARGASYHSLAEVFRTAREQQWQGWELTPPADLHWAEQMEKEQNQ